MEDNCIWAVVEEFETSKSYWLSLTLLCLEFILNAVGIKKKTAYYSVLVSHGTMRFFFQWKDTADNK